MIRAAGLARRLPAAGRLAGLRFALFAWSEPAWLVIAAQGLLIFVNAGVGALACLMLTGLRLDGRRRG